MNVVISERLTFDPGPLTPGPPTEFGVELSQLCQLSQLLRFLLLNHDEP